MTTLVLTNELVYKSFMIGAKNVISEKNNLNAINVFPVPDGDTGTNLASMMRSILERSKLGDTTSETIQSIADAAIVGARGNSGIIFAEYIHGFSEDLVSDIDQETFVLRSEKAFTYAYSAIAKPVEGTMITVMRTWAEALKSFKQASSNFLDLMTKAYELAKEELLKTPEKLQVLKDNKVVDAGAKGFVHFIEGFIKALKGEDVEIDSHIDTIEELHVDHLEDATFRYCTEALITSKNIDLNDLRKNLAQFGDSLVVAGTKTTARIHIHSDRPDEVFAYLDGLSQIKEQKVDDMKRQFEAANHRKYDIALVTDSIADLPESVIDQYQIHQYPLNIHLNDTNYYDKVTMQSTRFYELMDSLETYPTSSQPNQKSLENFFSFLTTYYKKVIVLTVSSKMSGTYQVFEETAKRFKDANIKVIDSRQN
ncbi:MAG: fatty acid-binding protein DegV, partial [Tenericutes bacterium HGW-Tenericutes-6]